MEALGIGRNDKGLTLPIERVHDLIVLIIKALIREILLTSSHLSLLEEADLVALDIIDEMVMSSGTVMK